MCLIGWKSVLGLVWQSIDVSGVVHSERLRRVTGLAGRPASTSDGQRFRRAGQPSLLVWWLTLFRRLIVEYEIYLRATAQRPQENCSGLMRAPELLSGRRIG